MFKRVVLQFLFVIIHSHLCSVAQDKIFKEFDIRGIVDQEFEVSDAYEMTHAILELFKDEKPDMKTVALGADGRIHSPAIKQQITNALTESGINIIDIGTCTTPMMYFSVNTLPVDAGIMITASHNSGEYNGIKMRIGTQAVNGPKIQKIRDYYAAQVKQPLANQAGKIEKVNLTKTYIDYLVEAFPHLIGCEMHAILDCGNGAAGIVIPTLIEKMQWKNVKALYAEVDGTFPHHHADPTIESNMQDLKKAILEKQASFGLGFDGDADRMVPVTQSGLLVKGDQLLTLYSYEVLKNYPHSAVVFDVSSSLSLFKVIENIGGKAVISATGIAQVKQNMVDSNAMIGGEMSCHTIFSDRYFGFDDGIYSMMRLFELLDHSSQTLEQLVSELPKPFVSKLYRIPCERETSLKIVEQLKEECANKKDCQLITVDGLRVHLSNGWAIVRASNTEPVISIRFEGNTQTDLIAIKNSFYPVIAQYIPCEEILVEES